MRRRFALDHNFPQPVLAALTDALPMADLVPVRDIDPTPVRDYLEDIAKKTRISVSKLIADNRLPLAEIRRR